MSGHDESRRGVLTAIGTAAAAGLAGCVGGGGSAGGGQIPTVRTARLSTGATSLVAPIISERGWDEENGFELETVVRDSISAYYGDFVSGTYGTLPFGPSAAANRYTSGVGMQIVGGFDLSSTFWLTSDDSIESAADFEGEVIAAPLGSGAFALASTVIRGETNQSVEELSSRIINAPGPASPVQEVVAGNASIALSWEPALSTFRLKSDVPLRPVIDVREQYREAFGADSFHLVWAVRDAVLDENPDAVRGLVAASGQVGDLYASDPEAAIDIVVEHTENEREPLVEAIVNSGRLQWDLAPLEDVRDDIQTQFEVLADLEVIDEIPDDGIYADL